MNNPLENGGNPIFEDKNKNELSEDEGTFYDQPQISEKAALLEDDDFDTEMRKPKISW